MTRRPGPVRSTCRSAHASAKPLCHNTSRTGSDRRADTDRSQRYRRSRRRRRNRTARSGEVRSSFLRDEPAEVLGRHSDIQANGTGGHEAVILTNKPLAKKLVKACAAPTSFPHQGEILSVTAQSITSGSATPSRLVVRDDRDVAAIKHSLLELIREMRHDNALAHGERSAVLIAEMMLDNIFEARRPFTAEVASGRTSRLTVPP
jgi:hypothetical protein